MDNFSVLTCLYSFLAVFILLSFLALIIRLVTALFPARSGDGLDPAVISAIHTAVAAKIPGARVTHIEEIQK